MRRHRLFWLLLCCCFLTTISSCDDDDVLVLAPSRHAGSDQQHNIPTAPDRPAVVTEWTYPVSEWAKAGSILMHTPGEELFEGVIHPTAGLFEHYFDVEKAAEEHIHYIEMLQKNGIEVHTVMDILNEVEIEKLRVLVKKVLVYDISDIKDESAEASEKYRQDIIQEMSRSDLIRCLLMQPIVKLHKTDNNTGYWAEYISRPLMNLYFTRDQRDRKSVV